LLWYLVVMKKTLEYATFMGRECEVDPKCIEILANHRIDRNENEYLHCKDVTAAAHSCASWIPMLLYPTEAMPFVDLDLFDKTRAKYSFSNLYMEKQGDYQPWSDLMQASSDFRRGAIEEGYTLRLTALSHTFGPGYFSEIGPQQETCGLPPYTSAHGAYITALLYQFVTTSIWERCIGIFTCMPSAYRSRRISIKNVCCTGAIKTSAEYMSDEVWVRFSGDLSDMVVELAFPQNLDKKDARVFVNGLPYQFTISEKEQKVTIIMGDGMIDPEITLR
jgi:hypothetical protein